MPFPCRTVLRVLLVVGVLSILLGAGPAATPVDPPAYRVVDLGTLAEPHSDFADSESQAYAINVSGLVVGISGTGAGTDAFLWDPGSGQMQSLDVFRRGSGAFGINAVGDTAGFLTTRRGQMHAARTRGCASVDLSALVEGVGGQAFGINDLGDVVGQVATGATTTHAFLWSVTEPIVSSNGLVDLDTLGGASSKAFAVNNIRQVVGVSATELGAQHAFRWSNGFMRDLGTLGGARSEARAINVLGHVVGSADTASAQSHAFRWTPRGMEDLGTLGGRSSAASGINNAGQIVGTSATPDGRQHAFFFSDPTGMVDLNRRIDYAVGEEWELVEARGINDGGWIVGTAIHNGQRHAFLLIPIGGEELPHPLAVPDCDQGGQQGGVGGAPVPVPLTRIAVFRPSTREWIVRNPDGSRTTVQFGEPGDQPVPADYLGLGYDQIAVFRPSTRQWLIRRDDRTTVGPIPFGLPGDMPVPADYLGLHHDQIAVFRPGSQEWLIRRAVDDATMVGPIQFGAPGDTPVPARYLLLESDPDQIAVFRPSTGQWLIRRATDDAQTIGPILFMQPRDRPVPGNYMKEGFGNAQLAVLKPGSMQWFIRNAGSDPARSDAEVVGPIPFGQPGDAPVPGAYIAGDHIQIALFHPGPPSVWRIRRDDGTELKPIALGEPGDQPVPAGYPFKLGR
jgi:probable HAF family extracellular repeat protein